jgi:hypothetical protein
MRAGALTGAINKSTTLYPVRVPNRSHDHSQGCAKVNLIPSILALEEDEIQCV